MLVIVCHVCGDFCLVFIVSYHGFPKFLKLKVPCTRNIAYVAFYVKNLIHCYGLYSLYSQAQRPEESLFVRKMLFIIIIMITPPP